MNRYEPEGNEMADELDYDPELVAWLRKQLDADERVAQEAIADAHDDGRWTAGMGAWQAERIDGVGITIYDEGGHTAEQAEHIARWDPDRVLTGVKAKQKIIDWAIAFMEGDHAPWNADLLMMLAEPYADREGFRDEWRTTWTKEDA